MTIKHIGWGLVILGTVLQVAETLSQNSATLNNIPFNQTSLGSILGPIESKLPFPLGWTLLIAGVFTLYVVPLAVKE